MEPKPKIACLIVPHFSVAVERRDSHSLVEKPIVIGGMPYEKGKVYDVSEEAAMSGVERGIALRQAEELCPEAVFLPLVEEKYLRALQELLEVLQSFSPKVEPEGLGTVYLEVSGLEALYGDDVRLCRTIDAAVRERTRLEATLGLATSKFVAWVAACSAGPVLAALGPQAQGLRTGLRVQDKCLSKALIVKPGHERGFLRDLSISLLPISEEMRRRLSLLGIKTMGELASLPAQAVLAQFGREGGLAYRLARGQDGREIIPWNKQLSLEASEEFDSPVENMDLLLEKAHELAGGLIGQLHASFRVCQKVIVTLCFDNGSAQERSLAFHEPTSSRPKVELNIAQLLRSLEYPCGVSGLGLSLRGIRPENGRQLQLFLTSTPLSTGAQGGMNGNLDQTLKGLVFKYGTDRFRQAVLVDGQAFLPETRFLLVEYEPRG